MDEKQIDGASASSKPSTWKTWLLAVFAAIALVLAGTGGPVVRLFFISLIGRTVLWAVFLGTAKLWWDEVKWIRWQPKIAVLSTLAGC